MRSSDEQRAMQLREAHREGGAQRDTGQPAVGTTFRGYNVHSDGPPTLSALEKIQRSLYQAEPDLQACPPKTLHVSLAWLLAVHELSG